jgi:hypothetical protein
VLQYKYFNFLLNFCSSSNFFTLFGNLLYNLVPIFATLFLKSVVLQNRTWRSDSWRLQWSRILSINIIFSIFYFVKHITSLIYKHVSGIILRAPKRFLQEAFRATLLIILTIFPCNLKILLLSGSLHHKVKPYFRWTWKCAKYMFLKIYWLVVPLR